MHGPREKLLYIPAIVPDHSRPDYIVTVDVNPESETYLQVRYRQFPEVWATFLPSGVQAHVNLTTAMARYLCGKADKHLNG